MAATHADEGSDPVRAARATLRVERRRVVDEREAFRAFRSRVSSIADDAGAARSDPSALGRNAIGGDTIGEDAVGVGGLGGPVRDATGATAPSSRLVAVRDAYLATVMSVPHYEAEYDDTYEQSVAAEFGPEIAYALTRSSSFHGEYKRSLLAAIETAIQEREALIDALETEGESVERAHSRLAPIREEIGAIESELWGDADAEGAGPTDSTAADFGALDACRARTGALVADCDRIAARRQRVLADHERRLALGDDLDLPTYCYQDLAVTYPVLAAVGEVGDRLDGLRGRIEGAMALSE